MIGSRTSSERRYAFHIPQKVADRKRLFNDELSDLTVTFNSMTAELLVQYENLDEKVQQRTKELEDQKRLAEAANEAKSMFVANLSHELKTPLSTLTPQGVEEIINIHQTVFWACVRWLWLRRIFQRGAARTWK